MNKQANVREFKALEAAIAASEADVEAKKWRQAELAAEAVADGMSRREYAREVGKHESTIRTYVKVWDRWGAGVLPHPLFKDAIAQAATGEEITSREWNRRNAERREPTRHEDRVAMATKLMADPEVVKDTAEAVLDPATLSGRLLAQAAYDQDADKRRRRRDQEEQSRADKALPLPAYMAKMVVQMNEWTLGLAALVDDLDELPDGRGRELVSDAARKLAEQAQRWVDRLERKPDLRVIEGNAIRETVAS